MERSSGSFLVFLCTIAAISLSNAVGVQGTEQCGVKIRNEYPLNHVATVGEFPWMIRLLELQCIDVDCDYVHIGGGALIALNKVLTAAHRIVDSDVTDIITHAGEHDRLGDTEGTRQKRKVKTKVVHPQFEIIYRNYDLAILILEAPFQAMPHIGTVCLPTYQENFENRNCLVSGWGKHDISDSHYPTILKKIELRIISRKQCERQLGVTPLGPYFDLPTGLICAVGKHRNVCVGDGGGPLVCPLAESPDRYQLAGIVAWGVGCNKTVPTVYANVAKTRTWIDTQMELN